MNNALITLWLVYVLIAPLTAADANFQRGIEKSAADPVLVWSQTDSTEFQGIRLEVPEGVSVATDGSTYFYATTAPPPVLLVPGTRCAEVRAGIEAPMAFLDETKCRFARHPAVACSGTLICAGAAGAVLPAGAIVPHAVSSPSLTALTNYDYVQVGVGKDVSGITAYGERARIAMTDRTDTYTNTQECHFRWGGMTWPSGTFMQAGTAMCANQPTGQWKTFCYGWDDNRAFTTWQYWDSTTTTDSAYHTYSVAADYVGSYTYKCKKDSTTLYTNIADHTGYATPGLSSVVELAGANGKLDPARSKAAPNTHAAAIEYLNGAGAWQVPSQNYFSWAWDSTYTYPGQNACPLFNLGTDYFPVNVPWPTMTVGYSRPCRAHSDPAW